MKYLLSGLCMLFFSVAQCQNVGIGHSSPTIRLDVLSDFSHTARFDGPNSMYISFNENGIYRGYIGSFGGAAEDVDFGTGGLNTTGKLHLSIKGSPKVTLIPNGNMGIGTQVPIQKLDVAGSFGFDGPLFVKNNSGTAGQVLTSSGASTPSWQNAALSNRTRFAIGLNSTTANKAIEFTQRYNLTPADITIGDSTITVHKTGLYHFELNLHFRAQYSGSYSFFAAPTINLAFFIFPDLYIALYEKELTLKTYYIGVSPQYAHQEKYSIDLHVNAGQEINIIRQFSGQNTNVNFLNTGYFTGYLISSP